MRGQIDRLETHSSPKSGFSAVTRKRPVSYLQWLELLLLAGATTLLSYRSCEAAAIAILAMYILRVQSRESLEVYVINGRLLECKAIIYAKDF